MCAYACLCECACPRQCVCVCVCLVNISCGTGGLWLITKFLNVRHVAGVNLGTWLRDINTSPVQREAAVCVCVCVCVWARVLCSVYLGCKTLARVPNDQRTSLRAPSDLKHIHRNTHYIRQTKCEDYLLDSFDLGTPRGKSLAVYCEPLGSRVCWARCSVDSWRLRERPALTSTLWKE